MNPTYLQSLRASFSRMSNQLSRTTGRRNYRRKRSHILESLENRVLMSIVPADDFYAVRAGDSVVLSTANVLANSLEEEGTSLCVSITGTPSHGTLQADPGGMRYTPSIGFTGLDTIAYTIAKEDGTDSATGYFYVEVYQGRSLATGNFQAVADSYTIFSDQHLYYFDVLQNDVFTSGTVGEITNISSCSQGTATVVERDNRDTILFQPNANAFGNTTFTYTVTETSGATRTATVSIQFVSTPTAWQSNNIAAGNIAFGGTNATFSSGTGTSTLGANFTPMIQGSVYTTLSGSDTLTQMTIPGSGVQNGTGTQNSQVNIHSWSLANGDWSYSESATWTYAFQIDNGTSFSGNYTYSLYVSNLGGAQTQTLWVTETDHYTVHSNTSTSTTTNSTTEIGTNSATTLANLFYDTNTGTIMGLDTRSVTMTSQANGSGTYQYSVEGGGVSGTTNTHSSYIGKNSTNYSYSGINHQIVSVIGTYTDTGRQQASTSFTGSGSSHVESTEGTLATTLNTTSVSTTFSESGGETESQFFSVHGNYDYSLDAWNTAGTGRVQSSSWSEWDSSGSGSYSRVTDTPQKQQSFSGTQNTTASRSISTQTHQTFLLQSSGWVLNTGSAAQSGSSENTYRFSGSGTYSESGSSTGSGTGGSQFSSWQKNGSAIESGGNTQNNTWSLSNLYSCGEWITTGTQQGSGSKNTAYSYSATGRYDRTLSLSSASTSGGQISLSNGSFSESGFEISSGSHAVSAVLDEYGTWQGSETGSETVGKASHSTREANGIFEVSHLNISGSASEAGEEHSTENWLLAYTRTPSTNGWLQTGGTQTGSASSRAELHYAGSGTTVDVWQNGSFVSQTASGGGSFSGSLSPESEETLTVTRSISQDHMDAEATQSTRTFANGVWQMTSGTGATSGSSDSFNSESKQGTYWYGNGDWDSQTTPEGNYNLSLVSGTISGSQASEEHTSFTTAGTWNTSTSRWDTTGSLIGSAEESYQYQKSGSGSYRYLQDDSPEMSTGYYHCTQSGSGTITESQSSTSTHRSDWTALWTREESGSSEGWKLSSGSADHSGNWWHDEFCITIAWWRVFHGGKQNRPVESCA